MLCSPIVVQWSDTSEPPSPTKGAYFINKTSFETYSSQESLEYTPVTQILVQFNLENKCVALISIPLLSIGASAGGPPR